MTVLTYGETMLRLFPASAGERLENAHSWRMEPGGSESNVAVALARLGVSSRHLTRLPPGPLGDRVVASLRAHGVDVSCVARGGARAGLYFTELGCGPRAASVLYDRDGSAFAEAGVGDYDLERAFEDVGRLHVSGITAALGSDPCATLLEVVDARPDGCALSVDLNHRATLWTRRGTGAAEVMWPLVERAETLFANESDLADALGLTVPGPGDAAGYGEAAAACFERAPALARVVVSLRESASASSNRFGAVWLERGADATVAEPRAVDPVADRVGTGDAFAAGVLEGLVAGRSAADALVRAVSLAALCHTVLGDASVFGASDIERLLSDAGGRIVR